MKSFQRFLLKLYCPFPEFPHKSHWIGCCRVVLFLNNSMEKPDIIKNYDIYYSQKSKQDFKNIFTLW